MTRRLPHQLERLIHAANNGQLPEGRPTFHGGTVDLNAYVREWSGHYLTDKRSEAITRLWVAYNAWKHAEGLLGKIPTWVSSKGKHNTTQEGRRDKWTSNN